LLVLTRKLGEGIVIGTDVLVRVIEVKGGQVKLGIEAPRETAVHREEVYRRICQENLRAAAHTPSKLDGVVQAFNTPRDNGMSNDNGTSKDR